MERNQDVTLLRVERARQKLYKTQQRYGLLTHPEVIKQSIVLDGLLNQYSSKKSMC
ncbi:aspartyl-phosphate phosphatase Spo0E family protein [Paenibacillus wynnii]|uniref:aspartyl-phosphate phosphatase Spo0E family protein n=1 Tax=Paenibacillus wynnii TaxID=268407 RepID=UPI0009FBD219|nr:aspartyl-phosphate phosphatase Spo0E family protein [Paenibacillus wynnii]